MSQLTTKLTAVAGFALLSLAPGFGSACEYDGSTSASATPPAQLAATAAPEVSRAPTSARALKAPASKKVAKQHVEKSKEASRSDVKVAALTAN